MMQSHTHTPKKTQQTVKSFEIKSRHICLKMLTEAYINDVEHSTPIQDTSVVTFDHAVGSNSYVSLTTHY